MPFPRERTRRALPWAASSRTASAGWHRWFPGLSGDPSTKDLRKQGERLYRGRSSRKPHQRPRTQFTSKSPQPEATRQGPGFICAEQVAFQRKLVHQACSTSRPRGAGGLHSAQLPLVLSPASGQRLGARLSACPPTLCGVGLQPDHSPSLPHRSRGGRHTQRGKVWTSTSALLGTPADTARLGVCPRVSGVF